MTDNKKGNFEPFDFYRTDMDLLWRYDNEKFLKLSDYGITEQEVYSYKKLIEQRRKEAEERHVIYGHRGNFFKVLAVLFLIWLFFFVIGYFNDFMREYDTLFDISTYFVYPGFIWVLYRVYQYFAIFIESMQERIEEGHKYPINRHPDGYNPRIEKYLNDLLWKLKDYPKR